MNGKLKSQGSALEKTFKRFFWVLASYRIPKGPADVFKPNAAHSVLLLRPDRLGDFLLSAPAMRALEKKLGRGSKLTIVAGERNHQVAQLLFPRAKVLVFRKRFFPRLQLFLQLWRSRFDAVIDLHSYPFSTTSALMALLSGASRRIGFWDNGEYKELSRRVFNFGAPPPAEDLHESAKSLLLAGKLAPETKKTKVELLSFPPNDTTTLWEVDHFFEGLGLGKGTKLVAIHPTLQKADNRWSQKNYLELVRLLGRSKNIKVLVVHGLGEEGELERFKAALGAPSHVFVLPQSNVLFILEALKRADVLVCGDSGLTHLAAGVTKLVSIFGPSEPARWGPLASGKLKHQVLRAKDQRCDSVRPSEVAREIKKIL